MTQDVRGPYPVSSRLFDAETALVHAEAELVEARRLLVEWLEVTSRYAPPTGPLVDETRAFIKGGKEWLT